MDEIVKSRICHMSVIDVLISYYAFHTDVKINIVSNVEASTVLLENGVYIMLEFLMVDGRVGVL